MARWPVGGRALAVLLATAVAPAAAARDPAPAGAATTITAKKVIDGLDTAVAFSFGPGNQVWYVEKTTGEIRIHDLDTDSDRRFYVVSGVDGQGERGMLGIALHPRFPEEPFVFVYASRTVRQHLRNQILRITDDGGSGRNPKTILSTPASSSPYHNGGRILFGPDGMLYAIVGDGHDASNAQDTTGNDQGKILRMTPAGAVPDTNPIHGSRIWAYGIRNSFGFAFDPETGNLWESENGPECNDELNRIRRGRNYGWGPNETCSGRAPANTNQDGPRPVLPELWYTPTIAPTGVAFCDRCGLGSRSNGRLLFGAANTGEIRRVTLTSDRSGVRRQKVVYTHPSSVLSIEVGPGGALFFCDFGAIYQLVRS